jgi:hypothetical protein
MLSGAPISYSPANIIAISKATTEFEGHVFASENGLRSAGFAAQRIKTGPHMSLRHASEKCVAHRVSA